MAVTVAMLLVLFVLGAAAGAAIDHLAYTIPAHESWRQAPACAACGQPRPVRALVPLLGPLWARRCAGCGAGLPWLRPATELVTGTLFALAYLRYGLHPGTAVTIVFIAVLLVVLRIDWRHHLIFPQVIYAGLLLAFAGAVFLPARPHDLLWSVVAAVAAAALFLFLYALALVLYRRRALGSGDVVLAAMIGAMAGPGTVAALTLGMLLGAVGGLTLVALRVRTMRDFIPYGAYLCAGTIIALLVF